MSRMTREQRRAGGHARAQVGAEPVTPEALGWEVTPQAFKLGPGGIKVPPPPPTYAPGPGVPAPPPQAPRDPDDGAPDLSTDLDDVEPGQVATETFLTAVVFGLAGIALGFVFYPNIARALPGRGR